ncbi:hypothetical protein E1180_15790 [Roseibium denhamense]|uniref:TolB amino-terminal domain-containing protein n=1 Tax=Roseibium denhamense TaxID=76305 RepID=A0ABY1PLJ3_9HYPH|nr:hypothetical protein [Roseibium denhamense]MTI06973.1 hypothetical protein [Roseibium denhamense]SMP36676.1 TolB amino-terminal domain-containing protein [Roseibium denhamense]
MNDTLPLEQLRGSDEAPDRKMIESHLARIVQSSKFADTTRLKRFLKHIVTEALEGRSESLKGYALGVDVFDKPSDFDPGTDTIVRVQASKLRARLEAYYAQEGSRDPVRIKLPKGQYVPIFEIAERELGPASLAQRGDARVSVAVMPFENLSEDPSLQNLALAFSVDILTALSRFRELRVLSRHVTWRYIDARPEPKALRADLGVGYLVEGTYRRTETAVRVTVHLVCTRTGDAVLSESFDRDLSAQSHFEIQDDVAGRTAAKIAAPHGMIHRVGSWCCTETDNLDAYEARLLATEYWRAPSPEAHARIQSMLERALELDPDYAGAWGTLAIIYLDTLRHGYTKEESPTLDRALAAAQRAVDLDASNATGLHALFLIHHIRGNLSAFEEAARRAVEANPNYPDMLADLSICHGFAGDVAAARAAITRAFDLCPNPPGWFHAATLLVEFIEERYDLALEATRKIGDALWTGPELYEAICLSLLGRLDEADECLKQYIEAYGDPMVFLEGTFEIFGKPAYLQERILTALEAIPSGRRTA